ncbi:MAG: hypothetical protein IPN29_00750 [Saprospiraceae bacterium]|nr:hypothetical protein [Saprospiraceae bacterium]
MSSSLLSGIPFRDSVIMFLGGGAAATGIADLIVDALQLEGLSREEAMKRLWIVDKDGLVTKGRKSIIAHKLPYAHDHAPLNFLDAITEIKPNILIGASGAGGAFTRDVIEEMASNHERPVIFALSNPTSNAECTAAQAYEWSNGRAIFVSGSPFDKVVYQGNTFLFPARETMSIFSPGLALEPSPVMLKYCQTRSSSLPQKFWQNKGVMAPCTRA